MTSPDQYRGKPITITGEIGRLYEFRAPPNHHGVNRLYEAWIITSDSGWEHPYRVVCSAIPPEIKPDDGKHPSVRVTGYFFKREGYETAGGKLHAAPTLLAGRLFLYQPPRGGPPVEDVVPWMIGVISVVGLVMLATVLGFALGDARGKRAKALAAATVTTVDVAALSRADQRISIEESLRRLEDGTLFDEDHAHELNGHADQEKQDDQTVDLPTPLPPTRPPQS